MERNSRNGIKSQTSPLKSARKIITVKGKRSSNSDLLKVNKNKKRIYNRVKANLALHQVKNKELAAAIGVSEQTVSKWCTNYSQPTVPQLYAVAVYLNIPVADLLEPQ